MPTAHSAVKMMKLIRMVVSSGACTASFPYSSVSGPMYTAISMVARPKPRFMPACRIAEMVAEAMPTRLVSTLPMTV